MREVCQHLDSKAENGEVTVGCCLESVCDQDYSAAMTCLSGLVGQSLHRLGLVA